MDTLLNLKKLSSRRDFKGYTFDKTYFLKINKINMGWGNW